MNNTLEVRKTMQMYRDFNELYGALMGFLPDRGVQIHWAALEQVAPLAVWRLNIPKQIGDSEKTSYYHELRIDDVLFYSLTDERIEVPNDTEAPF